MEPLCSTWLPSLGPGEEPATGSDQQSTDAIAAAVNCGGSSLAAAIEGTDGSGSGEGSGADGGGGPDGGGGGGGLLASIGEGGGDDGGGGEGGGEGDGGRDDGAVGGAQQLSPS